MSTVSDDIKSLVDKVAAGVVTPDELMKELFQQLELASGDKTKKVLYNNTYGGFGVGEQFQTWYKQYIVDKRLNIQISEDDYSYFNSHHSEFRTHASECAVDYGKYILQQNPELNQLMRKVWPWIDKLLINDQCILYLKDFNKCRISKQYKFNYWNTDLIRDTCNKLEVWLNTFGELHYNKLLDHRTIINLEMKYGGTYGLILQAFLDWYNPQPDAGVPDLKDEGDIPNMYIEQIGLDCMGSGKYGMTIDRPSISVDTIPYLVPHIINEYDGAESVTKGYLHRTDNNSQDHNCHTQDHSSSDDDDDDDE